MQFNPTTVQRRIAMAAAAVVAILLYLQTRSSGLDESPWLIGVLVVAALMVAAFAPAQPTPAVSAGAASSVPAVAPEVAFRAARAVIEPAFVALAENTNDAFKPDVMTAAFVDHARLQAVKLAWVAAAMAIAQRDVGFLKGDRMAAYALIGGNAVLNLIKGMPEMADDGGKMTITASAKEMASCSIALDLAAQGVATERKHPMKPAYAMVEKDFPFAKVSRPDIADQAERLEAAYGPLFRVAVAAAASR